MVNALNEGMINALKEGMINALNEGVFDHVLLQHSPQQNTRCSFLLLAKHGVFFVRGMTSPVIIGSFQCPNVSSINKLINMLK